MKKRILLYNWIPFDEAEGKGGGVTIYVRNLISRMVRDDCFELFFLSSGRAYDMNQYRIFIEPTFNVFGGKVKSFQIVNSPVLAAANLSFPYPDISNDDEALKRVVGNFISEYGFDVIHFQNLEGLGIRVLELKEVFAETKFIYSVHNYYMVCPQVMLWQEGKGCCREEECGLCCVDCMPKDVHAFKVMLNQFVDARGEKNGRLLEVKRALGEYYAQKDAGIYEMGEEEKQRLGAEFKRFRRLNVEYVNRYMDTVLAVSKRTAEILIEKGVDAKKVCVDYIGTKAAELAEKKCRYPYHGGMFHICYIGYMRRMKGFYFLLESLEAMPESMSEKIFVTLAAAKTDEGAEARILKLQEKFAGVLYYDGYTHASLPKVLKGANLGIVPPLWEDNLPQAAIEMQAAGIPLLCSNVGGTKEIVKSEGFVFEAGDVCDFHRKLKKIMDTPDMTEAYWKKAPCLVTMEEHVRSLKKLYGCGEKTLCLK